MADKKEEVLINVSNEETPKVSKESEVLTPKHTANKPPKVPNAGNESHLTRRRSFTKPKSRFGEQSYLIESDQMEETNLATQEQLGSPYRHSFNKASPNIRTDSSVSKTFSMTSNGEKEYEEIIKKVKLHKEKLKGVKPKVVFESSISQCQDTSQDINSNTKNTSLPT
ncbi:hypothetical protein GOBAR_DD26853 [Gossypium barbadense]|nr:hypothetical protein GOBAR_DD26853 [Gossypium barbadense]